MLIAAVGIVLSILGIFLVRTKEGASQKELLASLGRGVNVSSFFIAIFAFLILWVLKIPNFTGV
jgi:K(+)-stimulated pyrophosphate-energized sodium pump